MSAVTKALRHIERLMAARQPKPRHAKRAKSAYRPKEIAYTPPRSEPDVSALVETFAPPPPVEPASAKAARNPADEALLRSLRARLGAEEGVNFSGLTPIAGGGTPIEPASFSPTASSSTTGGSFNVRPNCKAVDAKTGLVCKLGAHTGEHGHERGRFRLVASAPVRRAVDDAAWNTGDSGGP